MGCSADRACGSRLRLTSPPQAVAVNGFLAPSRARVLSQACVRLLSRYIEWRW